MNMSASISTFIQKIIIKDQKKFVIITDKSQGTKYEGFKEQIIEILNNHMKEQVNKDLVQDDSILHILSKNFIEGIIEIAKHYKNDKWLVNSINTLVTYHMKGMEHLM
jgi:dTDP-D-glucose 4,6-dehydratase